MERSQLFLSTTIRFFCPDSSSCFENGLTFELLGVAENIADLEKLLEKKKPQVILMDFELPEGDGISATAFVHKQSPETKVVMLTGYDNPALIFSRPEGWGSRLPAQNTRSKEILETLRKVADGEVFLNPDLASKFLHEFQRDQEVEELRRLVQTLTNRERKYCAW